MKKEECETILDAIKELKVDFKDLKTEVKTDFKSLDEKLNKNLLSINTINTTIKIVSGAIALIIALTGIYFTYLNCSKNTLSNSYIAQTTVSAPAPIANPLSVEQTMVNS